MSKLEATITQRLVWFDVGPKPAKGMKGGALTIRTDSKYYDEGIHTPTSMVTAYTIFANDDDDGFLKDVKEFTGLEIVEMDTYYTLQFLVDMGDGKLTEATVAANLLSFVNMHFKAYDPVAADKAKQKNLKARGWA